ncbi:MAG TPA: hypothetical protein VF510_03235 [Ktedonobacterales bacterium]
MGWQSLEERFETLPLVLAGPIVRRVEPRSVSVWVALKQRCLVTLRIYTRDAVSGELTPVLSGTQRTVRLGDHLHIAVITAMLPPGAAPLAPQHLYYYDLFFVPQSDISSGMSAPDPVAARDQVAVPESAPHLHSPGVLSSPSSGATADDLHRLVYPGHPLPGFVLPPDDIGSLRIFHGSCRKPHGEGHDALSALDLVLAESAGDARARPQLLFLTGDQIYGDDVAMPLLPTLTDAGDHLLSGNQQEILPLVEQPARVFGPGRRTIAIRDLARLTTTKPANHLLSRAEYLAMYLFAWSDTLWPDAFPPVERLWQSGPPPTNGEREHEADEYRAHSESLARFRATLPQVRRALANISTLMICDDHDVTDDWFLDGAWCRNVLGSPLGRRIVRNGLFAYALCQAWGNDPAQFAGANGSTLLAAIDTWHGNEMDAAAGLIAELLGLPDGFGGQGELPHSPRALHWHYRFERPGYSVLVLDTRTRREYPSPDLPPGLLSPSALAEQIPPGKAEMTIVISATPALGVSLLERFQAFNAMHSDNYAFDREAWSLDRATYQHLLAALSKLRRVVILSGDVHYGFASTLDYWPAAGQSAKLIDFTSSSLCNPSDGVHKAILTVAYPQLFRMLGRGEIPPIEMFVWDSHVVNVQVIHEAISAIRARWVHIFQAIPRLFEVLRSSSALMLPAHGWPPHAFDLHPPDRRYRLRYLRDMRKPTPAVAAQIVPEERLTHPFRPYGVKPERPETPGEAVVSVLDALHAEKSQQEQAKETGDQSLADRALALVRVFTEGIRNAEHNLLHSGNTLAREAVVRRDAWVHSWNYEMHIVGDTNIGEISFDTAKREAIQRLWWWHPDTPDRPTPATEYRATFDPLAPIDAPPLP